MSDISLSIDAIFESGVLNSATIKTAGYAIILAEALLPIFFVFAILYDMALRTLGTADGDRPSYFSKKELVRLAALMLMAGPLYLAIFWPLTSAASAIGKITTPTISQISEGREEVLQRIEKNNTENTNTDGTVAPPDEGEKESLSWSDFISGLNLFMFFNAGLKAATYLIIVIIGGVMKMAALVLARIFFVIGPLAIAFSIIPAFKDKIVSWFGVYLNLLFVPIVINFLDFLYYGTIVEAFKGSSITNPMVDLTFNIAIIVVYCLVFWITSFIVGSSAAGTVMSTAATLATSVAGYGMKMAGGAGGAASAASKAGNMIEPNKE